MSGVGHRVSAIARLDGPRDAILAALADLQHGVVARWQLLELGFTPAAIQERLHQGRLHRIYRGVYAVGHRRLDRKGRWMAAMLACGPNSVLSHRAAIAVWDLRPLAGGAVDVTVPGRTRAGQAGIRIHRVRKLLAEDCAEVDNLPVTSVHRALLDYAEIATMQQLRLAIEAADRKELFDGRALEAVMARNYGRHGLKPLKAAVAQLNGPAPWTRSELERRFLALIREGGLPEPQVNVIVASEQVDFFWPGPRVVVEVDGYEWHKSRRQFERDRVKDTKLQLAGCRVLRVTQPRIEFEPWRLLGDVVAMLGAPPGAATTGP